MPTTTTRNHRLGIEVEQQGRVLLTRLHVGPRGEFGREIAANLSGDLPLYDQPTYDQTLNAGRFVGEEN